MLNKNQHCLEAIIEASERIIEYTSGLKSADELDNDYKSFDAAMMNFVIIGEMGINYLRNSKIIILKLNG